MDKDSKLISEAYSKTNENYEAGDEALNWVPEDLKGKTITDVEYDSTVGKGYYNINILLDDGTSILVKLDTDIEIPAPDPGDAVDAAERHYGPDR